MVAAATAPAEEPVLRPCSVGSLSRSPVGLLVGFPAWSFWFPSCTCEVVCLTNSWRCHLSCLWCFLSLFFRIKIGFVSNMVQRRRASSCASFTVLISPLLRLSHLHPSALFGQGNCSPISAVLLVVFGVVSSLSVSMGAA